jgi:hypothetical protein
MVPICRCIHVGSLVTDKATSSDPGAGPPGHDKALASGGGMHGRCWMFVRALNRLAQGSPQVCIYAYDPSLLSGGYIRPSSTKIRTIMRTSPKPPLG